MGDLLWKGSRLCGVAVLRKIGALMEMTLEELAKQLGGEIQGSKTVLIRGVAPPETAQETDLTFAENKTYFRRAVQSPAAAVVTDRVYEETEKPLLLVQNVRVAMAHALGLFYPEPSYPGGRHPTAVVSPEAKVDESVWIGPHCVVEAGAEIGPRTVLLAGVYVGQGVRIGADCRLFPQVTIYPGVQIGNRVRIHAGAVIGSDGYGYVLHEGRHVKIPQVGTVQIGDDVEIGANVTIDRGAMGPTVIGEGTKIDNLVQIGHNVKVGRHCILVSQVGIAGSTQLGDYVTLAGQVGLAGHLRIGNRVTVAAKAGVMNSIPDGEIWLGIPACPASQAKRQIVAIRHLPDLIKRWKQLEQQVRQLLETLRNEGQDSKPSSE